MEYKYKYAVKMAGLHGAIQIHGLSILEKTLSETKIPGAKFYYTDIGLIVEIRDSISVVPHANVAFATLDVPAAPKAVKGK